MSKGAGWREGGVPYKRRGNIARIQPSSSNKMPGLAISSYRIPTGPRADQLWQIAPPRPQHCTDPLTEQYFQKGGQRWKTQKIKAQLESRPSSLGQHKITSTSSLSLSMSLSLPPSLPLSNSLTLSLSLSLYSFQWQELLLYQDVARHTLPFNNLKKVDFGPYSSRPAFLNRRAAARYRDLALIIPGRERFSWNLSF